MGRQKLTLFEQKTREWQAPTCPGFARTLLGLRALGKARVGLLGGSFNPPHAGHVHLAQTALTQLNLHRLVWLVTPGNPLKKHQQQNLPSTSERVKLCENLVRQFNLKNTIVSALEEHLQSHYSYHTIKTLKDLLPQSQLFWVVGEDALATLPQFYRYQDLVNLINIFVIARGGYSTSCSLNQPFAHQYASRRCNTVVEFTAQAPPLSGDRSQPPLKTKWLYHKGPSVCLSSSALRASS